ncbi:MAG: extracellular solute-binding protein [Rhodospirillales bacterium]|nr:extracellular solute-binding protein [Rhodospirillales bacterium]
MRVFRSGLRRIFQTPVLLLLSLGLLGAAGPADAEGELHIYNWRAYTNPEVIDKFEQTYDVIVTLDEYETNAELLATLRAGNSGYDIVVPGFWAVQLLIEEDLLALTRPNGMENFKNVDRRWADVFWDPGRDYSVPYHWGTIGLAVDTAAYGGEVDSLKAIFDPSPELQGRISVVPEGADVIDAALRYLGKPHCSNDPEDLKTLTNLLQDAKRHWLWITYDIYAEMGSGNALLAFVWNPIAGFVREQKPALNYVYPREGVFGWMDNVVVPKDALNLENANLFQNFLMDPEIAAMNSVSNLAANAILGSDKFMPPGFADAPEIKLPAGVEPEFLPACPKEARNSYDAIWAEVVGPARAEKLINQALGGVAIRGYDPVAYFTEGRAVKGSEEIAHEWLGATWQFATAEHRDLFAADPVKYTPQYGGYCAGAMVNGYTVAANPENWRIVDGKLYLNFSEGGLLQWARNGPEAIRSADAQWEQLKVELTE